MKIQDKNQKSGGEEVTLREFLIKEHELIDSLGVFAALTILSQSFLKGSLDTLLSLIFLLLTILIFFELWEQFPEKRGSTRLALFESYLSISSVFIFLLWLSRLQKLNKDFPLFVASLLLYGPIMTFISTHIIKKFKIFNKVFGAKDNEKKSLRYVFGYMTIAIIFSGIFYFLSFFKNYINQFLDLF